MEWRKRPKESDMIRRGEIYYADLSPVVGSEQGGVRPVLVIQNDVGNKYAPTIIAAAIIDDIIGIIVLTFVIGMKTPDTNMGGVLAETALFFVFALGAGVVSYHIFKLVDKKWPHTRRIPIAGLAYCFAFAYIAEHFFGIADITGAYFAGIILCSIKDSDYIAEKMDINSYMLFGPIFFASIGLKTDIDDFSASILWFSVAFVIGAGGVSHSL